MAEDETPSRALAKLSDQALAPARSLVERTLAFLGDRGDSALAVPRRLIVAADGSAMFTTIAAAIAIAVDDDEIVVEPGNYVEHLTIDRSIRISGHGPRDRIILAPPTAKAPGIAITAGAPHLSGFTIDARALDFWGDGGDQLILVTGGRPTIEDLDLQGGQGVQFSGPATRGVLRDCLVREVLGPGTDGISPYYALRSIVWRKALLSITPNDDDGFRTIQDDGPYDGESGAILICKGASPEIENNDVVANGWAGITVVGAETKPIIRSNRVHDGQWTGVLIYGGAAPIIIRNVVEGNVLSAVTISGQSTRPVVRECTIRGNNPRGYLYVHGVLTGRERRRGTPSILVRRGATPRIEDNQIDSSGWDAAIQVQGRGTNPIVCDNRIDGRGCTGIRVRAGAAPTIENNEIRSGPHARSLIEVRGRESRPFVKRNQIHIGRGAGVLARRRAAPVIEGNTFIDEIRTFYNRGQVEVRAESGASPTVGRNFTFTWGTLHEAPYWEVARSSPDSGAANS